MRRILLALALSAPLTHAADIEGAFGLVLGEQIDVSELKKASDKPDSYEYLIDPPEKNEAFSFYQITVSPVTNTITTISGFNEPNNCTNAMEGITQALVQKYEVEYKKKAVIGGKQYGIEKNGGTINIGCNIASQLVIEYTQKALQEQQKQEEISKAAQTDTSNL